MSLDVAKAEDDADPRRQGRSRTWVLRALDNKVDAASHGFPNGKKQGDFNKKPRFPFT